MVIERQHNMTNKMTCAPSEDSDQPGHPPSLIRVIAVRMRKSWILEHTAKTDQTAQMRRLIRIFARRTFNFVSFIVLRLNLIDYKHI